MEVSNTFRKDDFSTIIKCRRIAEKVLGPGWSSKDLYNQDHDWNTHEDGVPVLAIGNCHIDVRFDT